MAVFLPHTVRCACGEPLVVQLADSVNAGRSPEVRDRILNGDFHRAACPRCGRKMTVEKPFYYTDLARNALFKVLPRGERYTWKEASKGLDVASSLIPDALGPAEGRTLRVVFGLDELREKLIAQDAKLDDRHVELLKVLLVYEHPILLRRTRLRLVLDAVSRDEYAFTANYEHDDKAFRLGMPARVVDRVVSDPEKLKEWTRKAHPAGGLFEIADHWVNMWRWSPQPTALDRLRTVAQDARDGKTLDVGSPAFAQMLAGLPHGSHLPPWAKVDLRTLFEYARGHDLQALEDRLFEIRFGIALEDDWSTNDDPDDIDTLWSLLKDLPETNVEGNTKIHEILLDAGGSSGLYSPSTGDISIGSAELADRESFEDVVRHEVGHSVHEANKDIVDRWLADRFGWKTFTDSDEGIDGWVDLMGGWGDLTDDQKLDVRQALRDGLGMGSMWGPGPTPSLPPGHPWNREGFGPRVAFEKTGASWFNNMQGWFSHAGRRFFLNYWYRTLLTLTEETVALIAQMPSPYAAMSHFEFFAELYALYYDLDDPRRPAIPADVAAWLDANVGAPHVAAAAARPMGLAPREPEGYETMDRPGKEPRARAKAPKKPKSASPKKPKKKFD